MISIWLADLTYTQHAVASETMPYGVACIAAFAKNRHLDLDIRLFKYPEKLIAALESDPLPAIIGFSNYVWNSGLSLAFARAIRSAQPQITIVFGGPHYSLIESERAQFLKEHPYIDFYVAGEGEVAFADLISALRIAKFDRAAVHGKIPSVHSLDEEGSFGTAATRPRLPTLEQIPPPYQLGLLDEFFDGRLVPTLQTNRGCPFSCTFCVEGESYYSKIASHEVEVIKEELHHIGARMGTVIANGGRNELIITDSNFGMYNKDEEVCRALAECQDKYDWPRYINATTGKNRRDRVLRSIALTRGAISLTGSVQSLDQVVLENIRRRNIDTSTLVELALSAKGAGTGSYSEVILGLPGDSRDAHFSSIRQLLDAGFDLLVMFQLSLLPGSELSTPANRNRFRMQTRFRVVPRCFGRYAVLGSDVCVAEIDEVCVGLDTLTFSDYLMCRKYDFHVAILHNHGPFNGLEKLIRSKGLSVADWIETAVDLEPPADVGEAVEQFMLETRRQLHDDRQTLARYVGQPANIEQYISGDLGNNEIYTYRAYAFMFALPGLIELAFTAFDRLCAAKDVTLSPEEKSFLKDMRQYILSRCQGALDLNSPNEVRPSLNFDLPRYEASPEATIGDVHFDRPRQVRLQFTAQQRTLLRGYGLTLGSDPRAMGRMLTKRQLYSFFRRVAPETVDEPSDCDLANRTKMVEGQMHGRVVVHADT